MFPFLLLYILFFLFYSLFFPPVLSTWLLYYLFCKFFLLLPLFLFPPTLQFSLSVIVSFSPLILSSWPILLCSLLFLYYFTFRYPLSTSLLLTTSFHIFPVFRRICSRLPYFHYSKRRIYQSMPRQQCSSAIAAIFLLQRPARHRAPDCAAVTVNGGEKRAKCVKLNSAHMLSPSPSPLSHWSVPMQLTRVRQKLYSFK